VGLQRLTYVDTPSEASVSHPQNAQSISDENYNHAIHPSASAEPLTSELFPMGTPVTIRDIHGFSSFAEHILNPQPGFLIVCLRMTTHGAIVPLFPMAALGSPASGTMTILARPISTTAPRSIDPQ
jgi:hypothetical protein